MYPENFVLNMASDMETCRILKSAFTDETLTQTYDWLS
jgi:hypothetical protein